MGKSATQIGDFPRHVYTEKNAYWIDGGLHLHPSW